MKKYLLKLLAAKKAKNAEIDALLQKSIDAGTTPDEETEGQIKALEAERDGIEANIARVQKQIQAAADAEAEGVTDPEEDNPEKSKKSDNKKSSPSITTESNSPKGHSFAIAVKAQVLSRKSMEKGNFVSAIDIAKSWGASEEVVNYLTKKAVVGTTTDANFASALVEERTIENEFIELLRPQTILGKLQGFRDVPFNIKMAVQTSGSTVNWVGEAQPKPVGNPGIGSASLGFAKIAGIVVLSDELIRFSAPKADAIVLRDLTEQIAVFTDKSFIDETLADTAEHPAGITNGVAPVVASGTTAADIESDAQEVIDQFLAAGESIEGTYWIMGETFASRLSAMRTDLGVYYFTEMRTSTKEFMGRPVVVSQSSDQKLILVKPGNILLADDGQVEVNYSSEATIVDGSNTYNLFQENLTAVRAERFIRWKPVRKAAGWVDYSGIVPPSPPPAP